MFCQNCGNKLLEGAEFCQACGAKRMPDNNTTQATASRAEKPSKNKDGPSGLAKLCSLISYKLLGILMPSAKGDQEENSNELSELAQLCNLLRIILFITAGFFLLYFVVDLAMGIEDVIVIMLSAIISAVIAIRLKMIVAKEDYHKLNSVIILTIVLFLLTPLGNFFNIFYFIYWEVAFLVLFSILGFLVSSATLIVAVTINSKLKLSKFDSADKGGS